MQREITKEISAHIALARRVSQEFEPGFDPYNTLDRFNHEKEAEVVLSCLLRRQAE